MWTAPTTLIAPGPLKIPFPVTDQLVGLWDPELGITQDTSISEWADQSGEDNHWARVTNGPTISAEALNGLDVVNFDGVNDLMSQVAFLVGGNSAEMVLVCRRTTTSNKGWHRFGPSNQGCHMMYSNTLYETFGYSTRVGPISHGGAFDANEWGVYSVAKTHGGVMQIWANNGSIYSGASSPSYFASTFYLGSNTAGSVGGSYSWQGQIAEMAVWSKVLSSEDRASVFNYFNSKFALGL